MHPKPSYISFNSLAVEINGKLVRLVSYFKTNLVHSKIPEGTLSAFTGNLQNATDNLVMKVMFYLFCGFMSKSTIFLSWWDRANASCVLTSAFGSKCVLLKDRT